MSDGEVFLDGVRFLEHRDERGETRDEQWRRMKRERGSVLRGVLEGGGCTFQEIQELLAWLWCMKRVAEKIYRHRMTYDPVSIVVTEEQAEAFKRARG